MATDSLRDKSFYDEFTYLGKWWLPTKKSNAIDGTLRQDTNGRITLDLMAPLSAGGSIVDEMTGRMPSNGDTMEVIHGRLDTGEGITLFECQTGTSTFYHTGVQRQLYHVGILIENILFEDGSDTSFDEIRFELTHTNHWLGVKSIERRLGSKNYRIIAHKNRPSLKIEIPSESLKILTSHDLREQSGPSSRGIQVNHGFRVEFKKPRDLKEVLKIVFRFQQLFTLLGGEAFFTQRLAGRALDVHGVNKDGIRVRPPTSTWCAIFHGHAFRRLPVVKHSFDLVIRFPDISGMISRVFRKWFALFPAFAEVIDTYNFVHRMGDRLPLDLKFLLLTQALEAFSGRENPSPYLSSQKAKSIRKTLFKAIPPGTDQRVRKRIEESLAHFNSLTLADRLRKLIESLEPESQMLIASDIPKFVKKVKDTRNYRTHLSGDKSVYKPLEDLALWGATVRLEMLLMFLLLKKTGIREKLVRERLQRYTRSRFVDAPII